MRIRMTLDVVGWMGLVSDYQEISKHMRCRHLRLQSGGVGANLSSK